MVSRPESNWQHSGPSNEAASYGGFSQQQWMNDPQASHMTHDVQAFQTPTHHSEPGARFPSQAPQAYKPMYGLKSQLPPPPPPPPPQQQSHSGPPMHAMEQAPSGNTSHSGKRDGPPHAGFSRFPPPPFSQPPSSQQSGQHGAASHTPNQMPPHPPFPPYGFPQQQHLSFQDGQFTPSHLQSSQNPPSHHPVDPASQWDTVSRPQQWEQQTSSSFQQYPPAMPRFPPPHRPVPGTAPSSQGMDKPGQPKLQPYQSHRMRPKSRDHTQPSTPGSHQNRGFSHGLVKPELQGFEFDPAPPQSNQVMQEAEESEDQKWVKTWMKSRQKSERAQVGEKRTAVRIGDAQRRLTRFLQLLTDLRERRDEAADCLFKESDDGQWRHRCQQMKQQMEELSKLQAVISSRDFVEGLKKQVEKRKRKRERNRKRRQEEWEARETALKLQQEMVDAMVAKALQVKLEQEKEEALQKDVDNTLSEVRKKKQDANKTMELLRALRKLRHLRKDSAERKDGFRAPKELDDLFEEKVTGLERLMNRQKLLYVEEEKTLQVMLEEEQEETREKERQKKQLKEKQRAEKAWEEQLELLFGKTERIELGHPLFMFRQFHVQAEYDIQALLNIRRQWDAHIVPEGDAAGSSIPVAWVAPPKPANHIWATALENSLDT